MASMVWNIVVDRNDGDKENRGDFNKLLENLRGLKGEQPEQDYIDLNAVVRAPGFVLKDSNPDAAEPLQADGSSSAIAGATVELCNVTILGAGRYEAFATGHAESDFDYAGQPVAFSLFGGPLGTVGMGNTVEDSHDATSGTGYVPLWGSALFDAAEGDVVRLKVTQGGSAIPGKSAQAWGVLCVRRFGGTA